MKKKLMAMPLGSKIKELRKSLGLKQSNIAAESKETNWPIKQRSYEKAESGLDEIGHDLFEKIATKIMIYGPPITFPLLPD